MDAPQRYSNRVYWQGNLFPVAASCYSSNKNYSSFQDCWFLRYFVVDTTSKTSHFCTCEASGTTESLRNWSKKEIDFVMTSTSWLGSVKAGPRFKLENQWGNSNIRVGLRWRKKSWHEISGLFGPYVIPVPADCSRRQAVWSAWGKNYAAIMSQLRWFLIQSTWGKCRWGIGNSFHIVVPILMTNLDP